MSNVNSASERPYSVVPSKHAAHTSTSISSTSHAQYVGAHDAIRHGLKSVAHDVSHHTHHPVQNRLEKWDETRDNLKLNVHRNMYGLGAPAHTLMERKIASQVSSSRDHPFEGTSTNSLLLRRTRISRTCTAPTQFLSSISISSTAATRALSRENSCRVSMVNFVHVLKHALILNTF